jgi:hypothetical protein
MHRTMDEHSPMASPHSLGCQRNTELSRRPIGDKSHRIDIFDGGSSRYEKGKPCHA